MKEKDDISEKTKELIDEEISKIMQNSYEKAKQILLENKDKLEKLAKMLLEKEIINEEELKLIMEEDEDGKD